MTTVNRSALVVLMNDVQAALFDLDNTLIETHIDFPDMKRRVLALGKKWGVETDEMAGMDILAIVERVTAILKSITMSGADVGFHDAAWTLLAEIETEQCGHPVLLPGAAQVLHELQRRGVPVAVVTRNCRAVSEQLLSRGDLRCDALLAREDVAKTKPHPEHLLAALRALAAQYDTALEPARCLMVGDNVMDVQAGRAARMRVVGLRRGKPDTHFVACVPDLLLEDMAEFWAGMRNVE